MVIAKEIAVLRIFLDGVMNSCIFHLIEKNNYFSIRFKKKTLRFLTEMAYVLEMD